MIIFQFVLKYREVIMNKSLRFPRKTGEQGFFLIICYIFAIEDLNINGT